MLTGKVAIVTGAARNMGAAFAQTFARNGADVVVHYRSAEAAAEAEATVAAVRATGARGIAVAGDLAQTAAVRALFERTEAEFGAVDILVNAAGMVVKKPFVDVSEEEFDRAFGVNAKAAFFCMQEAARRMRDGGRIINLGTTLLGATTAFYGAYAGSKAPLEHFTRALAKEIGARGITVNTVAPGPIDSSFFYPVETPESIAFLEHMSVQNRLGRIDEVVPLVEFLASPAAGWITAQTIFVNGGFLAR